MFIHNENLMFGLFGIQADQIPLVIDFSNLSHCTIQYETGMINGVFLLLICY
jgi:hypothetical protein